MASKWARETAREIADGTPCPTHGQEWEKCCLMECALELNLRISAQLDSTRQSAFDAGLEAGARECEGLVTFIEDHSPVTDCVWCKALEDAAAAIRSRQQKEDQEVGNAG